MLLICQLDYCKWHRFRFRRVGQMILMDATHVHTGTGCLNNTISEIILCVFFLKLVFFNSLTIDAAEEN